MDTSGVALGWLALAFGVWESIGFLYWYGYVTISKIHFLWNLRMSRGAY